MLKSDQNWKVESTHTLEELFAGVLLKESLVNDGTREVVNHEVDNGLNLILGVTGIVGKGSILYAC